MRSYFVLTQNISQKIYHVIGIGILAFLFFPVSVFAATLQFSPSSGTYTEGSPLSVGVYVGSTNDAVNAMSGVVSFDETLLEVTSIAKNQSIVSLWVQEPTFSNSAGTVNFEGIVLNPGFSGASGKIITINFRVKKAGTAPLSFASGAVLANDGSGTDVLSKLGTASFTLKTVTPPEDTDSDVNDDSIPNDASTPSIPEIVSTTHPNEMWSSQTVGLFNFTLQEGVTAVRLLQDDRIDSVPTVVYQPAISSREIVDLKEGVSYLHVQYRNENGWGEINHYKLQIDTHPPDSFNITEVGQGVFTFDARDSLSDIAYYEVQIDEGIPTRFVDTGDHIYSAPLQNAGTHTLSAKAFDKAGNALSANIDFVIQAISEAIVTPPPLTVRENFVEKGQLVIAILSVVIPFVALIILLLALLYYVWHKLGGLRKRIDKEVLEAKMIVHKAFALLRDDLVEDIATLEKASKKRKLTTAEAKILKRLRTNIDEAEKVIIKEVEDIEEEVQ